ncbi:hypothetical protein [Methanoculleus chikugoensis]|uniref:Uncharacterized protein n=1 Tax=Methanoculleus chikugoensis TaxID=118126 RepID=A0ABM7H8R1_9EURY|nr:hypothetical protein [Methanoculleus chikugoensis]BBL69250.1 hypothetical protein MchiMG62_24310 [Methanoculleus chikugoensis]
MDKDYFADLRKELLLHDFMISILQDEQNKRREELNELECKMKEIEKIFGELKQRAKVNKTK